MPLPQFHPAVQAWFASTFPDGATPAQLEAWPAIASGKPRADRRAHRLGQDAGRISRGHRFAGARRRGGTLRDETRVVYVSPLKALSNDIQRNLDAPLAGISAEMIKLGSRAPEIRAPVRTGDTSQTERAAMRRTPPHILVTTPESLYLLLTSASGREMLHTVRTVIVDEIHAVAQTKRGAHLALTLERARGQRRAARAAHRPVRDAEADRGSREVPGREWWCRAPKVVVRRERQVRLDLERRGDRRLLGPGTDSHPARSSSTRATSASATSTS